MTVNYVEIHIETKSINAKQNEQEVRAFVDKVEKLALQELSYSSLEIRTVVHRNVVQLAGKVTDYTTSTKAKD